MRMIQRLMLFPAAVHRDPNIDLWMEQKSGPLGQIAQHWFAVMRSCGPDVRELLHDGHPTACVGEAAFAYVNAFTSHVNVGFFLGAELEDPNHLLQGTGKFVRHVKLRPEQKANVAGIERLVRVAYADMRRRAASA
jgi:hypothetical protein